MARRAVSFLWVFMAVVLGGFFLAHGDLVLPLLEEKQPRVSSSLFSPEITYPVIRVVDGDTIDVKNDGTVVRLRLIGVNTPETVDPRRPIECFGQEASVRAKALLSGQSVYVATDSTQGLHDKYGRTLAYVFLSDGTLFNREMIAEGYAHEYTYRFPYKYQNEFKSAERSARGGDLGLWAPGACFGHPL